MKLQKSLAVVLTSAALFSMCTGTMAEASKKVEEPKIVSVPANIEESFSQIEQLFLDHSKVDHRDINQKYAILHQIQAHSSFIIEQLEHVKSKAIFDICDNRLKKIDDRVRSASTQHLRDGLIFEDEK